MNSKSNNQTGNELCFIDKFFVPADSIEEFTQRMNYNRNFIKNLPSFIEDKVYEQRDAEGNLNIITIAVLENQHYVDEAKSAVQSEYKRIEFNMPAFIERLKIKHERGLYHLMRQ